MGGKGNEAQEWPATVLGVTGDGQIRQDRSCNADLVRHHEARRRVVAEPIMPFFKGRRLWVTMGGQGILLPHKATKW